MRVSTHACIYMRNTTCTCMHVYVHQLYCRIFTSQLHAQPAESTSKCMYRLACCSACWWLTNGKGDAREKEVL